MCNNRASPTTASSQHLLFHLNHAQSAHVVICAFGGLILASLQFAIGSEIIAYYYRVLGHDVSYPLRSTA